MRRLGQTLLIATATLALPTAAWALGAPGAGEGASPEPVAALLLLAGAVPAAWLYARSRRSRVGRD